MNRRITLIILCLAMGPDSGARAHAPPDPVATQVQRLQNGDVVDRLRAAKSLGTMGAAAAPGVPALVQALCDRDAIVIGEAVEALHRIGVPAVPALVLALEATDEHLRHRAAETLSRIEPTDPVAVRALLKALKDPSAEVRRRAALALENAGKAEQPREGVVVGLIGALADRDGTVRISAAVTLGNIGADAKDAITPLSHQLDDKDAGIRAVAGEAIRKITAPKPPISP